MTGERKMTQVSGAGKVVALLRCGKNDNVDNDRQGVAADKARIERCMQYGKDNT